MSVWTHICGVIRFDGIKGLTPAPELGNTCGFEDDEAAWDDCNVPCGSEGSLQYSVWDNPDDSCMAMSTVSFFGDLRSYEDVDEVVAYFERITTGPLVRQGMFSVHVEGQKPRTFIHGDDGWTEIKGE